MQSFKDRNGRSWNLEITVADVRRVRARLHVDLNGMSQGGFEALAKIMADVVQVADILWVICEPQAKDLRVTEVTDDGKTTASRPYTDEDFGGALAGDAMADACDAFQEACIDFFFRRDARPTARKVLAKGRDVAALSLKEMDDEASKTPAELLQKLKDRYGSGQASSESTPAPSATDSSP